MGDIVEEMDSHRRKSFALLTRKGPDGRPEAEYGEQQASMSRASRSFSKAISAHHGSTGTFLRTRILAAEPPM